MQLLKTHISSPRASAWSFAPTVFPAHKSKLWLLLFSMKFAGCPQGHPSPLCVAFPCVIPDSSNWTASTSLTATWHHVPAAFVACSTHRIIPEPLRELPCNQIMVRIIVGYEIGFFHKRICQGMSVCLLRTLLVSLKYGLIGQHSTVHFSRWSLWPS